MIGNDSNRISEDNLLYVMALRSVVIFVLAIAFWLSRSKFGISLPVEPILVSIGLFVLVNIARMLRLRKTSQWELFGELCVDVSALALILYFSGGVSNPFASLFLVFLTIGAMLLSARLSWLLAAVVLGAYGFLVFNFRPMVHRHNLSSSWNPLLDLHTVGAWITFALSAIIIATLLVKMVASLRERERRLAAAREESLRDERVVALGVFAAGTAHELGTPLATIATIARELERRLGASPEMQTMLSSLRTQVEVCKQHLTSLTQKSGVDRSEQCLSKPISEFLSETLVDWQAMRPEARIKFFSPPTQTAPNIIAEPTLKQALISVLNNAADVSADKIEVNAHWSADGIKLDVLDYGPGMSDTDLQRAGHNTFSTKSARHGLGIGLYLARVTLERFGGSLTLNNRPSGGIQATLLIPVV
jgi:two-component system, sensor histidine kinase RegB